MCNTITNIILYIYVFNFQILVLAYVAVTFAQDDGQYRPELYNKGGNDGRYYPSDDGKYVHIGDGDRGQYNGDNGQYVHVDDGDRGQYNGDNGKYVHQGDGDRGQYRPDQHASGTGHGSGNRFPHGNGNANGGGSGAGNGHGHGSGSGSGSGFVPNRPTNNVDSYNGKYRIIRFEKDQEEDGYHYL